jgi:hypothetical protein
MPTGSSVKDAAGDAADFANAMTTFTGLQVGITFAAVDAVAGLDVSQYPGDATMLSLKKGTNLNLVGYYLYPAPSRNSQRTDPADNSWMGHRAVLAAQGWTIAPIYVGEQDPTALTASQKKTLSANPSETKGTTDGDAAAALMSSQGFVHGSIVYLDIETGSPLGAAEQDYIKAWCSAISADNYTPGVYCPGTDASTVAKLAPTAVLWVADYDPMAYSAYFAGAGIATFPTWEVSGSGHADAIMWQYEIGYNIKAPGVSIRNVDLDSFQFAPIVWQSGVSGDFALMANWSGSTSPGASNGVVLASGGNYTVTSSANEAVASLVTGATVTLKITGGIFTAAYGTGPGVGANAGTISVGEGALLQVGGNVDNTGTLDADGGTVVIGGAVTGAGNATIEGNGKIEFVSNSSANITFAPNSTGLLKLDNNGFTGAIFGLGPADAIDLANINFADHPTIGFSPVTDILTVTDKKAKISEAITILGTPGALTAQSDGSGGTLITSALQMAQAIASFPGNESGLASSLPDYPSQLTSQNFLAAGAHGKV